MNEEVLETVYDQKPPTCSNYLEAIKEKKKPTPKLVAFDDMSHGGSLRTRPTAASPAVLFGFFWNGLVHGGQPVVKLEPFMRVCMPEVVNIAIPGLQSSRCQGWSPWQPKSGYDLNSNGGLCVGAALGA